MLDPLVYPKGWSALDQARVTDAIKAQHGPPPDRDDLAFQAEFLSDADARTAVVAVLEEVADVLATHPPHRRAADAAHLRDWLIAEWAHPFRPAREWPTLRAFAAAVNEALAGKPWWPYVMSRETAPSGGPRARHAGACPNQARWVADHLRALQPLTRHRLATLGGPDSKTTQRLLHGYGAEDAIRVKLARGLSDAYRQDGRPQIIRPDDIPRD